MARPRTYVRDEVVSRAADLFVRKGYEGAHLEELVRVTGLNRFSLYKEFGGKEGLFQAALDAYLERMDSLGAILRREPRGLSNLRVFYADLLSRDFPHGCLAVNTIREKHVVPERVFATIERFAADSEEQLRGNLAAARERGGTGRDHGRGRARAGAHGAEHGPDDLRRGGAGARVGAAGRGVARTRVALAGPGRCRREASRRRPQPFPHPGKAAAWWIQAASWVSSRESCSWTSR
jgi:AcrR family transcriptional regulator